MQIGNFNLHTICKQVQGYPNYEISICGQVRNFKTKRILNPWISDTGYYCVKFTKDKQRMNHYVHRLVLMNFIPNLYNCKCVV